MKKTTKIISEKDIKDGALILLCGDVSSGKTEICCDIVEFYGKQFGCRLFDLVGDTEYFYSSDTTLPGLTYLKKYTSKNMVINKKQSTTQLVKEIQSFVRKLNSKIVIIDSWDVLDDKREWFAKKLRYIARYYSIVIVVTSKMTVNQNSEKEVIPSKKDFEKIENIGTLSTKKVFISRPAMYLNCPDKTTIYEY